jgi:uncharacterized protein YxjI
MLFQRRRFLVKERVAVLKLTDTYDIVDPETKQPVAIAKDEPPAWAKLLRLIVKKPLLPTTVNVYEKEGMPAAIAIEKRPGFFKSTLIVRHPGQGEIGRLTTKVFSLGGGFHVFDRGGRKVGEVKGDWKGWNFKMLDEHGREIGVVTKKWAGIGKELFTSADTYMVAVHDQVTPTAEQTPMLLAAGLAIDISYKEAA